jgi:transaldolase
MKIFLATADVEELRWAADLGLVDGVLTTPAMLTRQSDTENSEPRELLEALCHATPLPVCAAVGAINADDAYRDGRELAKLGDQMMIQIPLVEDAIGAMRRLRADGVRVVATLISTAPQAILAAKAGAAIVSVAIDALDRHGQDGDALVTDVCTLFEQHGTECDVLAAFPRDGAQFARCARAGAHIVAATPSLLRALLVNPLTDRGLDHLLQDLSVHHRQRVET